MTIKEFAREQANTQRPPYRRWSSVVRKARSMSVRGSWSDWAWYFGTTKGFPFEPSDIPSDLSR